MKWTVPRRERRQTISKNSVRLPSPVAATTSSTSTPKLNAENVCAKCKTAIAMVLCKRGAQVAIRRGHTVNARRTTTHSAGHNYAGDGPLGSFGVEDPLVMGIEDSAAPKFADGAFY